MWMFVAIRSGTSTYSHEAHVAFLWKNPAIHMLL